MNRPSFDEYFTDMAKLVSSRATCIRRKAGCVLVDVRGHVLATGYNGVGAGLPHCIDSPCPGSVAKSGRSLDACQAIHAEQNALLQCRNVYEIHTAYVTASPCIHCVKLFENTSTERIVFAERYAHDSPARKEWLRSGASHEWLHFNQ